MRTNDRELTFTYSVKKHKSVVVESLLEGRKHYSMSFRK